MPYVLVKDRIIAPMRVWETAEVVSNGTIVTNETKDWRARIDSFLHGVPVFRVVREIRYRRTFEVPVPLTSS